MAHLCLCVLLIILSGCQLITRVESLAIVQLSSDEYTAYEGEGLLNVIITRTGDINQDVVVDLTLRDITAKDGFDYGPFPIPAVSLPLTLPAGQVQTVFGVEIREDNIVEPPETFSVGLSIPSFQSGVALGRVNKALVTLFDRSDATLPEIINTFRPIFDSSRDEVVITARNSTYTTTVTILGQQNVANRDLINTEANISCKAKGGPVSTITWSRTDSDGNIMMLEEPEFSMFVPRLGRSVVTVPLPAQETACATYMCNATNLVGSVFGTVEVCPIYYDCTVGMDVSSCTSSCGLGVQLRTLDCVQQTNDVDSSIDFADVPPGLYVQPIEFCNLGECPVRAFQYDDSNFTACSRSCGRGIQTREVSCSLTIDGVHIETADISQCVEFGAGPPVTERECNDFPCPRWEITDLYGPCSSSCSGGMQDRTVVCMQLIPMVNTNDFNDTVVKDGLCSIDLMPARMRMCNTQIPCPHRWQVAQWGQCDEFNCQERSVFCAQYDTSIPDEAWPINDSFCEAFSQRPPGVRNCGGGVCQRGMWSAQPFDQLDCPAICGFGVHSRSVICVERGNASVSLESGYCNQRTMPSETERCIVRNCPGRCDFEPNFCRVLAFLSLCKDGRFQPITQQCCKSCPLQATPIPLLPSRN